MDENSYRKKIEEILFEKGLITSDQLSTLKVEEIRHKIRPEKFIVEHGWVDEKKLVEAKSEAYNIPIVDLGDKRVARDVLLSVSEDFAKSYGLVPFEADQTAVKVAMVDPFDIRALRYLKNLYGRKVDTYYSYPSQLQEFIQSKYGQQIDAEVDEAVEEVQTEDTIKIDEDVKNIKQVEQEINEMSSIARIVNMILEYAAKAKASDIHIEPMDKKLRVRFRINGVLVTRLDDLPPTIAAALVSRIKILSKLKIDEKRIPQDGRMQIVVDNKEIDLRVSTLPTAYGEKVVIRLLMKSSRIPDITESGLRGPGLKLYLNTLSLTRGIVLITGPTGSGKTRTLASSLSRVNREEINIVTVEDPIEIRIPGVNQVQVNPDAGLTFASGLRSILRQDPDVIMVGEIRDEETARLATQASLTGHLVFATLHTNSAAGALPRLLDMQIEPYLISSTVQLVVAQRLVRTVCQHCKEEYEAPVEVVKDIHRVLDGLKGFDLYSYPKNDCPICKPGDVCTHTQEEIANARGGEKPVNNTDRLKVKLYRGKGCTKCDDSGYAGRIGIFEVLQVDDKIATMIMEHRSASTIQGVAKENGMIDMVQDGYLKALEGITTIEEVIRVSKG